eukprot:gb/GECH01010478.1/.p1 GENE.gb/GECH01010478.1/~~gb/GECH01010478.1/.p1  ORF type:complete len:195 (+),score=26.70 gb/GECH01010478.1/:1-585(+)
MLKNHPNIANLENINGDVPRDKYGDLMKVDLFERDSNTLDDIRSGTCRIEVIEAQDLPKRDILGSSDPYVLIEKIPEGSFFEVLVDQTQVIQQNLNPKWNSSFDIEINNCAKEKILLEVFDWDRFTSDDYIGRVVINMKSLYKKIPVNIWLPLRLKDGSEKGKIHLNLEALDFGPPKCDMPPDETPENLVEFDY